MPQIDTLSPYPGTPGTTITGTGPDLGVCTSIVIYITEVVGGNTNATRVVNLTASLTRVDQNTVTFTMPDFGVVVPTAAKAKAIYTVSSVQYYTNIYSYETDVTSVTPPPATPPTPTYGYSIPDNPMKYPSSVQKWQFHDPYDGNSGTNTWTFEVNPDAMSEPWPTRTINAAYTTAVDGQVLLTEGAPQLAQWTFAGQIYNAHQYDMFRSWVYDRNRRVQVKDHFGRIITCLLTKFDTTPVGRRSDYWRHSYQITALVISVGQPTEVPS